MLMVPKLRVVGLLLKSVQTEMSLADEQWPLSSIINQLCSDWAQLMQITGPGNKHSVATHVAMWRPLAQLCVAGVGCIKRYRCRNVLIFVADR